MQQIEAARSDEEINRHILEELRKIESNSAYPTAALQLQLQHKPERSAGTKSPNRKERRAVAARSLKPQVRH